MKFLAFVDFHHDYDDYEILKQRIKEYDPDFIICAGDFTWFGDDLEFVLKSFLKFNKKIYIIHGNHETEKETRDFCSKHKMLIFSHNKIIQIEDTVFVFYGGGGFAEREPGFTKLIKNNSDILKDSKNIVLITHAPPKDTIIDAINEDWHVGVKDFKTFIEEYRPVLSVSGHIHESYKKQEDIDGSLLINPGGDGEIFEL